jgi:hypothetical protein
MSNIYTFAVSYLLVRRFLNFFNHLIINVLEKCQDLCGNNDQ